MNRNRRSQLVLTSVLVVIALAGAYLMGRSDERSGRAFSLVQSSTSATSAICGSVG